MWKWCITQDQIGEPEETWWETNALRLHHLYHLTQVWKNNIKVALSCNLTKFYPASKLFIWGSCEKSRKSRTLAASPLARAFSCSQSSHGIQTLGPSHQRDRKIKITVPLFSGFFCKFKNNDRNILVCREVVISSFTSYSVFANLNLQRVIGNTRIEHSSNE